MAEKKDEMIVKHPLEVRLTEEELKGFGKQIAGAIAKRTRIENELEDFKSQKKAELTAVESIITQCSQLLNSEKEFRLVECKVEFDWKGKGTKTTTRMDTGEVIRSEGISNEERQRFFPVGPIPLKDAKSKAAGE